LSRIIFLGKIAEMGMGAKGPVEETPIGILFSEKNRFPMAKRQCA